MKRLAVAGAVLLVVGAAEAMACSAPSGALNTADLGTTLQTSGRVACNGGPGNWENQEIHLAGSLQDYKKGPSDPVDPTSTVGTYSIADDGTGHGIITYHYPPGLTFSYYLVNQAGGAPNPGTYQFFSGADGTSGPCTASIMIMVESTGGGCA